ncbi:hypothetical protein PIB30_042580 [Stylosanthes scabra]|uniref:Putative plant transposon protein domain-containing protein n=1 Tax=Stylosanthes scabra TaxID=79078 RepID=A0ABU6RFB4_9FABA|nr:hypothetical protein [Stylosanthes scabra]
MAPKSRKKNDLDVPSSSQIPDTSPEPTYDTTRFKSLAHERDFEEVVQFTFPIPEVPFSLKRNEFRHIKDDITRRGWDLLCNPPQKKMGIMLLREFYANARMTRREKQSNPHYTTFVRGKEIHFSPISIKVILKLPDIGDSEQSYEARRQADDQRLNDVLRDIGEPFAQWKLDNKKKPSQIKCRELNPTARGLILLGDWMSRLSYSSLKISQLLQKAKMTKRLPFPSIIYRFLYANGIKKIDGDELIPIERPINAESMTKNKYLEMQQEIQQHIPQPPPQFQQEQIEFRKRTDFKMDYLCWRLQQTNPHLAPIPSQDIPTFCLNNIEKGKGRFEGALRPMPVGGSSSKGKDIEDNVHGKKKAWEARDDGDSDED